jgi:hypothetical protein
MLYSLAETKDSISSTYSDNMDDNYITKVGRMKVQNGISCAITLEFWNLHQVWKNLPLGNRGLWLQIVEIEGQQYPCSNKDQLSVRLIQAVLIPSYLTLLA